MPIYDCDCTKLSYPWFPPILHSFYNKVHTWGQIFFFLLEKICYRVGPKETLKMETLSDCTKLSYPWFPPILHSFYNKIHTWGQNIFFVGKYMLQSRSERNLENGNLSVKTRAYSRKRKTINMNFKNATISPLWCYYGNTVILIPFRARFKHAHPFCRCRCG